MTLGIGIVVAVLAALVGPSAALGTTATVPPGQMSVRAGSLFALPGQAVSFTIGSYTGGPNLCASATSSTLTIDFSTPGVAPLVSHPDVATMDTQPVVVTVPANAATDDRVTIQYECAGVTGPTAPASNLVLYPVVITVNGPNIVSSGPIAPAEGPYTFVLHTGFCVGSALSPVFKIWPANAPNDFVTVPDVQGPWGVHTATLATLPASWHAQTGEAELDCTVPGPPAAVPVSAGPYTILLIPTGPGPTSTATPTTLATSSTSALGPQTMSHPAQPVATTPTFTG